MDLQDEFQRFSRASTALLRGETPPAAILEQRAQLRRAINFCVEPLLSMAFGLADVSPLQTAAAATEERLKPDEPIVLAIQLQAVQAAGDSLVEAVDELRLQLEKAQTGYPFLDRLITSLNAFLFGFPVAEALAQQSGQFAASVQAWRATSIPAYAEAVESMRKALPFLQGALNDREWSQAVQACRHLRQAGAQLREAEKQAPAGRCPMCSQPMGGAACPACKFLFSAERMRGPEDEYQYLLAVVSMNPPMSRLFQALESSQGVAPALEQFQDDIERRLAQLGVENLQEEALTLLQSGLDELKAHVQSPSPERSRAGALQLLRAFHALQSPA